MKQIIPKVIKFKLGCRKYPLFNGFLSSYEQILSKSFHGTDNDNNDISLFLGSIFSYEGEKRLRMEFLWLYHCNN